MSPQPRNTKIMRRKGPWGRAGWFRSRYLTLTDATAGRLERSRCHCAAESPHPRHLPQARSMEVQAGLSHRQPPHQVGAGLPACVLVRGREGVGMWEGMEAQEWGQGHCKVLQPLQGTKGSNGLS